MNSIDIKKEHRKCLDISDKKGNKFTVKKLLGSGAFGTVYLSCKNNTDNCTYVSKFIKIGKPLTYNLRDFIIIKEQNKKYLEAILSVKKEIEIQKIAADAGISPKIYTEFICEDYYIFVMDLLVGFEKWSDFKGNNPGKVENTKKKIAEKIKEMNSYGIQHNDLHGDNIIIKNNGDIMIIDFGLAEIDTNPLDESERFLSGGFELRSSDFISKPFKLSRPRDDTVEVNSVVSSDDSFGTTPSPPQIFEQLSSNNNDNMDVDLDFNS